MHVEVRHVSWIAIWCIIKELYEFEATSFKQKIIFIIKTYEQHM